MQITKDTISSHIAHYFAQALNEDVNTIDVHRDMDQYGLSSVLVVSLIGDLESLLMLELSPSLIFEHPTIDEIAGRLEELYLESRSAAVRAG